MTHPEELLAEYVDGSLEQDERAAVEAHLAGCEQCRDEVGAARRVRGALAALPEVELPEGFRADRRARRVRPASGGRHERLRRTLVGVGAAAASIAAIVGVAVLIGNGGGGSSSPSATSGGGVHSAASTAYDKARVDQLANSLAATSTKDTFGSENTAGAQTRTPTSSNVGLEPDAPVPPRPSVTCIPGAGSLPKSAHPLQTISRATFNGTPASIGAYRVGHSIRVVVASRSDCSVLYTTSRPLR